MIVIVYKIPMTIMSKQQRSISMEMKLFSIRDTKGEMYNQPFFKHTHGEAERYFREVKADDKSLVCKYPEDFDLYYVGAFDTIKGTMTCPDTAQHLIKAVALP